jgi:Flp pilus assembly pilin Flp
MTAQRRPHDRERGQSVVEYTLIIAFIALLVIAAQALLGPSVGTSLSRVNPFCRRRVCQCARSGTGMDPVDMDPTGRTLNPFPFFLHAARMWTCRAG